LIWSYIGLQLGPIVRKTKSLRSTVGPVIHTYKKANIIVEFDKKKSYERSYYAMNFLFWNNYRSGEPNLSK